MSFRPDLYKFPPVRRFLFKVSRARAFTTKYFLERYMEVVVVVVGRVEKWYNSLRTSVRKAFSAFQVWITPVFACGKVG